MNRTIVKRICNIHIEENFDNGFTIEEVINKALSENEPIGEAVPLIYTERKDGVRPEYDIRTDRFAMAQSAMDKVAQDITARRAEKMKTKPKEGEGGNSENGNSIVA